MNAEPTVENVLVELRHIAGEGVLVEADVFDNGSDPLHYSVTAWPQKGRVFAVGASFEECMIQVRQWHQGNKQ